MSFWLTIFTHMFLIWFRGGGDFEIQAQLKSEFESIFPRVIIDFSLFTPQWNALDSLLEMMNGGRVTHSHTYKFHVFFSLFSSTFSPLAVAENFFYHLMIFHDNFRIVKNFFSIVCVYSCTIYYSCMCACICVCQLHSFFFLFTFRFQCCFRHKILTIRFVIPILFSLFLFFSLVFWTTLNFFATKSQFSLQWKFQNRKFPFSTLFLSVFSFFFFTTFTTVVFAVALHTNCSIFSFWREKLHGKLTGKLSPEHQYQRNVCARI